MELFYVFEVDERIMEYWVSDITDNLYTKIKELNIHNNIEDNECYQRYDCLKFYPGEIDTIECKKIIFIGFNEITENFDDILVSLGYRKK